jgi:glycosyltransferase involved in cell wall biosynthesis
MKFSIIIPTINRQSKLFLMLTSLKNQSYKNFEVIVVDQNDNEMLNYKIVEFQRDLKLLHIKAKPIGASNARNIGIEKATGDILTFPDDDCEYLDNFLEQVSNHFQHNNIDGLITTTEDKKDGKPIALLASEQKIVTKKNILSTVIEAGIFVKKDSINGCRFDINMGVGSLSPYWSDEGPDFILKLLQKGKNIVYCPQFKMYHPNPVKVYNKNTTIRSYKYGKGRGYFLRKNNYGLRFISYYLFLYLVGMLKGILFFDIHMFNYFRKGFKGRFEGYFLSK